MNKMKKSIRLSVIATFVISTLSYNAAIAKSTTSLQSSNEIDLAKQDESNAQIFVNNQQRSLYQIALLSGVSVTELRELNKGEYDNVDIVKIGDSILLPATSSLLPAKSTENAEKEDKYGLPTLGSSDSYSPSGSNSDVIEQNIAQALQTIGQVDWENTTAETLKADMEERAQNYAENYVRSQVNAALIDPLRSAAQNFLGRFGTAQLQFDVSDQAKLNNVNLSLFSPWYDSENTLLYTQVTYQTYEKDRRIGNFGIGQRWDVANDTWLLGYNVFFDHDFSRNHNRLGLGLEAWSDYMKFAANYYTPLSDWKNSEDFDDYLERAARGFDVRFQGYLPSYPHLGASLMYEQYFGDKVALFGTDNLQKDPYAVTIGVDYTPVPLFTIKGEHKQGEDANRQAKVELTMNYRVGVPLKDQLDPNMVQVARSLKGSRYDLVDRNNYIVLEYKEKKFSIDLASLGVWEENTTIPVGISTHNQKGALTPLEWNQATGILDINTLRADNGDLLYSGAPVLPFPASSGLTTINDIASWSILVPDYLHSGTGLTNPIGGTTINPGVYTFDVTATDGNGRTATSNAVWLKVKPSTLRSATITNTSPLGGGGGPLGSATDPATANGIDEIELTVEMSHSMMGFHDFNLFHKHAPVIPTLTPPVLSGTNHSQTALTQTDIDNLNDMYELKHNGTTLKFVIGDGITACPATARDCLLVKYAEKTAGDNAPTVPTDSYKIRVATDRNFTGSPVTVGLKNFTYTSPTPENIHFLGGVPARITIYNGATPVAVATNTKEFTMSDDLVVGNTYTIKVEDASNTDITSMMTIDWSLVGDNVSACAGSNTVLKGDTTAGGDDPTAALSPTVLFNVSNGSSYTFRDLMLPNPSYASIVAGGTTGGTATDVNGKTINFVKIGGAGTGLTQACAGDQGFKLRIDVN